MKQDAYIKMLLTVIAATSVASLARSLDQPPPVFAQATHRSGVQHVIIDDVVTAPGKGLPVTLESVSPLALLGNSAIHVLIDGVDPSLKYSGGVPVSPISSQTAVLPAASKPIRWQIEVDHCIGATLKQRGDAGWELVQVLFGARPQDFLAGRSQSEQESEFNKMAFCYYKKLVTE